jgi:hypothetical protein
MRELFRGAAVIVTGLVGAIIAWSSAMAQGEPPGRVGRLAFINGTVSFHDDVQSGWTPAVVNTPLTTGDALWTEPNARSEVSLAGTRIRMEGATELDMLALDDSQTRLQLGQGRIDVKSFAMDANQPYEIVTPRGTIKLLQQGDYYVEAGSTQDPTRLGVRSGAAQIQGLNGQVLAVRPNEVAEVTGDGSTMQLRTIQTAPPAPPAYWASRDRQVAYDPPQYLSAGMTGYEDLNAYGDWVNDGTYGQVWAPRAVPAGWAPYRTGHWSYVQPWGWTWIDEQPWGFAPYHYGRWANAGNRWVWVPPQRDVRPVYAPALVAFVGGVELAVTLGNQSAAPVGWFPLGPREAYVPPYTTDRDYYLRVNRTARVEDRILEDRWQRAQRREAFVAGQNAALINQRFATVVPTSAFVRSQPVMRSALRVQPQAIAAAPVAPVAAPPAATASVVSAAAAPNAAAPATVTPPATPQARAAAPPAPKPVDPKVEAAARANAEAALKTNNVAVAKTAVAEMPTLARPASAQPTAAPGPKVASAPAKAATGDKNRQVTPTLVPRQGAAPPTLNGNATAVEPAKPGEPPKQQQAAPQPQAAPSPAPQARPEAPRQQQATPPLPAPQQGRPAEPAKPQAAPQPQAKPVEAPRQQAAPQQQAPQPPQAQQPRPEPPKQPQAAPPAQRPAPQQQEGHAAPQRPQTAPQQVQPQQQAAPPQRQPAPQQHQAPQQVQPQQQAAPPQRQPAPQQQAAPQPHQAAPQPQQQPQHQAAPQPQQAQTPKPQGNDKKDDKK